MKKTFCNKCGKQTEDTISAEKSFGFTINGGTRMAVVAFEDEDAPDMDICFVCTLKEVAKAMRLSHYVNPPTMEAP